MKDLADLITDTNLYMNGNNLANLNAVLLKEIGLYCTNLLRVSSLIILKQIKK